MLIFEWKVVKEVISPPVKGFLFIIYFLTRLNTVKKRLSYCPTFLSY